MTQDSFEQSLRDMLKAPEEQLGDDASLDKVLKKANRQLGVGAIFTLFGRALESVLIGLSNGSEHIKPVSNLSEKYNPLHKVDK
ncbi:CrfX protein [Denitrificimonas sp. JX-1]|uniref:CrfX protein n=1 Tax=Denitrificimonas halotolerans TaxID=3098930 RepID=A0ABU5GPY9_9GAMM|nr:CrfX protein [Denitrificimonas sp. JX-1]MDY7219026.1 CrfX protein [Denitrificimonas sp. JX-1]